jgi:hypothetical protein
MLKIQRSWSEGPVLLLSGRIETDDVAELQRLLSLEAVGQEIALDLRDVTLIDREAVKFLARCEADRITLRHCPAFIREWIAADLAQNHAQELDPQGSIGRLGSDS